MSLPMWSVNSNSMLGSPKNSLSTSNSTLYGSTCVFEQEIDEALSKDTDLWLFPSCLSCKRSFDNTAEEWAMLHPVGSENDLEKRRAALANLDKIPEEEEDAEIQKEAHRLLQTKVGQAPGPRRRCVHCALVFCAECADNKVESSQGPSDAGISAWLKDTLPAWNVSGKAYFCDMCYEQFVLLQGCQHGFEVNLKDEMKQLAATKSIKELQEIAGLRVRASRDSNPEDSENESMEVSIEQSQAASLLLKRLQCLSRTNKPLTREILEELPLAGRWFPELVAMTSLCPGEERYDENSGKGVMWLVRLVVQALDDRRPDAIAMLVEKVQKQPLNFECAEVMPMVRAISRAACREDLSKNDRKGLDKLSVLVESVLSDTTKTSVEDLSSFCELLLLSMEDLESGSHSASFKFMLSETIDRLLRDAATQSSPEEGSDGSTAPGVASLRTFLFWGLHRRADEGLIWAQCSRQRLLARLGPANGLLQQLDFGNALCKGWCLQAAAAASAENRGFPHIFPPPLLLQAKGMERTRCFGLLHSGEKRESLNCKSGAKKLQIEVCGHEPGSKEEAEILLKHDGAMQKEYLVAETLCWMERLLWEDKELIDLRTRYGLTGDGPDDRIGRRELLCGYRILLLKRDVGLVEIVDDAYTLQDMRKRKGEAESTSEAHREPKSLMEFLSEMSWGGEAVLNMAQRRLAWTAAVSTAFRFLLGLGDRHMENLMVTKWGKLFDIDFGYALGKQPIDEVLVHRIAVMQKDLCNSPSPLRLDYDELKNAIGENLLEKLFWPVVRRSFVVLRRKSLVLTELLIAAATADPQTYGNQIPKIRKKVTNFVRERTQPLLSDEAAEKFIDALIRKARDAQVGFDLRDQVHEFNVKVKALNALCKGGKAFGKFASHGANALAKAGTFVSASVLFHCGVDWFEPGDIAGVAAATITGRTPSSGSPSQRQAALTEEASICDDDDSESGTVSIASTSSERAIDPAHSEDFDSGISSEEDIETDEDF